jgi:hypothetical protein
VIVILVVRTLIVRDITARRRDDAALFGATAVACAGEMCFMIVVVI